MAKLVGSNSCLEIYGISTAQAAALRYHGQLKLQRATPRPVCPYLLVEATFQSTLAGAVHLPDWVLVTTVRRPADKNENVVLYKRSADNANKTSEQRAP